MEVVNGTLAGKKGTFALGHLGTMAHGEQNLSINVVPDSGTGELAGISIVNQAPLPGTAGLLRRERVR